jgi:hypothetical protein
MEFLLMPRTCNVTSSQWDRAADLFELGLRHANQLAQELGVSPQTVSREMKKRGAKKGSRSRETVADLDAFLVRKRRREAHARALAETTAAERRAANLAVLDRMMVAILNADALGDLTLAEKAIHESASAFGARVSNRKRRCS